MASDTPTPLTDAFVVEHLPRGPDDDGLNPYSVMSSELSDFARRLERHCAELEAGLREIPLLASGWDSDGALGPKEPFSWETVARMAMDLARDLLEKQP